MRRNAACQGIQSKNVSIGQVFDVNVVADAGSVIGRVIRSEDLLVFTASQTVEDHRNQVEACGIGEIIPSRAGNVEVAQSDPVEAPCAFSIGHHPFADQLGLTVRIDGLLLNILGDHRNRRHPINGRRGRENHVLHAGFLHCQQNIRQTTDILTVVPRRTFNRFANLLLSSKMNNASDVFVDHCLGQDGQSLIACDIHFDKCRIANSIGCAGGQIVNNNNLFATFQQKTDNVCADVAGASRNKNAHGIQCTAIKSVVSADPSRLARPLASRAPGHS